MKALPVVSAQVEVITTTILPGKALLFSLPLMQERLLDPRLSTSVRSVLTDFNTDCSVPSE